MNPTVLPDRPPDQPRRRPRRPPAHRAARPPHAGPHLAPARRAPRLPGLLQVRDLPTRGRLQGARGVLAADPAHPRGAAARRRGLLLRQPRPGRGPRRPRARRPGHHRHAAGRAGLSKWRPPAATAPRWCSTTGWAARAARRSPAAWWKSEGATLVPPFDDDAVIAGQGTLALELLEDVPDLDMIVTPCGGGGLLSGTAVAARGLRPGDPPLGRGARGGRRHAAAPWQRASRSPSPSPPPSPTPSRPPPRRAHPRPRPRSDRGHPHRQRPRAAARHGPPRLPHQDRRRARRRRRLRRPPPRQGPGHRRPQGRHRPLRAATSTSTASRQLVAGLEV